MPLYIAQFTDGYTPVADGVVTVVRNYAHWLNEKYGQCVVFCPQTPDFTYDDAFEVQGFFSLPVMNHAPYRVGLPALDGKFKQQLKATNFDIVHAHAPLLSGNEAVRYGKKHGVPVVTTFHTKFYDDFLRYLGSETLANAGTKLLMTFYDKVDAVWTINQSTVQTLREYGYEGEITIVPHGTDLKMLDNPEQAIASVNKRFGLSEDENIFLFVGQQDWKKNTRLIIETLAKYAGESDNFKMLFVGEGFYKEEMQQLTQELGVADRFLFTGVIHNRDMLSAIMLRADALLFPSLYDTSGLVVTESAVMGTPAVVVKDTGPSEGIVHGENGYLCENNVDSLLQIVRTIAQHPQENMLVGENASKTLARSWESVVDDVYVKYLQVIESYHKKRMDEEHIKPT
ncbi:glycosyltransferase, partial [Eubacteriales bacterium OttesenSCG-928-N14]|nr:glycosyltransferase [Eubacteriales bacterium OttesenSCG-928-N14]